MKVAGKFQCGICETASVKWELLAPQRCPGSKANQWEAIRRELEQSQAKVGNGHFQVVSTTAIWCARCGAHEGLHGQSKAAPLTAPCRGNPKKLAGLARQRPLMRMMGGRNPVHDLPLGASFFNKTYTSHDWSKSQAPLAPTCSALHR